MTAKSIASPYVLF